MTLSKDIYPFQLVPKKQGVYTYTFIQLSDSLYKNVLLQNVSHQFEIFK